ncbi:ComEC/Rec2 family competence protein [Marmoricola sp. RAF53]|uniref:ComEC/Rec2 family competence protein n=1 Tax=Marmoricola sp. RAF53 TaxID=3233059 RepID=UPI003F959A79
MRDPVTPRAPDLRIVLLAVVAWGTALVAFAGAGTWPWVVVVAGLGSAWRARSPTVLGAVLVGAAVLVSVQVHQQTIRGSPVRALATQRAVVSAVAQVATDPVRRTGRYGEVLRFEATARDVTARGTRQRLRARVLVTVDDPDGPVPRTGARVRLVGRLQPAREPELAATLHVRGRVQVVESPGPLAAASARMRTAVRSASAGLADGPAALVPALVDGDESAHGGTGSIAPDFQVAGMTHLLAVSGTNLTLIVGALLLLARWCGVRARGLLLVGLLGVAGFVLLAGPEPSVLRAAAMGTVALLGTGRAGPGRGLRALGAGVLFLVLLDPWLARSVGFALSVVATGGILLLGPRWVAALRGWMPRAAAEAVAVPLAAQLACTPVGAAISGQVSLVAVAANLVCAPLVGPATVLGLAGGAVALLSTTAGRWVAAPAGWAAAGIIEVAERAAALPVPAIGWSSGSGAILALTCLCLVAAAVLGRVLARPGRSLLAAGVVTTLVLVPVPEPGWPPAGWVLVACDVGQGDALALRVGPGTAVVVDAGPDPRAVDRCLRRLRVRAVPVVVLTHFHADHVDGLAGVLRGRTVGRIDTSPLDDPAAGEEQVRALARRRDVPVREVRYAETTEIGPVRWQVLGPVRVPVPDSDSPPNDASVVLLVEAGGIRLLLMGDEERPSQRDLRRAWPGLRADVLKVAHHGSGNQDDDLVAGTGARLAVISVGRDNDYGHPARTTLDLLGRAGAEVRRTDRDGDVAVVVREGELAVVTRR